MSCPRSSALVLPPLARCSRLRPFLGSLAAPTVTRWRVFMFILCAATGQFAWRGSRADLVFRDRKCERCQANISNASLRAFDIPCSCVSLWNVQARNRALGACVTEGKAHTFGLPKQILRHRGANRHAAQTIPLMEFSLWRLSVLMGIAVPAVCQHLPWCAYGATVPGDGHSSTCPLETRHAAFSLFQL